MKKNVVLIILIVVVAVGVIILRTKQPNSTNSPKEFTIGSVLPLSGDFAQFGEEIRRGADLAVADMRQQGKKINYLSEDDQSVAAGSTNAANKLVRIDHVDAAFTATIQEVKPIASVFNTQKVPLLAVWDSNQIIKTAGPYIFTQGFGTETAGAKMADFAFNDLHLKKIAVIPQIDEWSILIADAFSQRFTQLGGSIVMHEEAPAQGNDFRTLIIKAKQQNPDGIYAPLLPQFFGPFLQQAKQLGLNSAMLTADSFSVADVDRAGLAAENTYFTNLYADGVNDLVKSYKDKYGSEPADPVFVSFGYDAIRSLVAAHDASVQSGSTIRDSLMRVDIQGIGTRINFAGTQASERTEKIYKVMQGKFVEVK
jgi:branched-chain amino acid transport system substrate-binding protein